MAQSGEGGGGGILQRLVLVRKGQVMPPGDSWTLSASPSPTHGAGEEDPWQGRDSALSHSEEVPRQRSSGGSAMDPATSLSPTAPPPCPPKLEAEPQPCTPLFYPSHLCMNLPGKGTLLFSPGHTVWLRAPRGL